MTDHDMADVIGRAGGWRKSSFSQGANDCVQITQEIAGWVGVRDSKLGPNSPVLTVTAQQWSALCAELPTMPAEATIGPVRICTAEETTTYSRGPVRTVWHWQHRDTGVELHYTAGERDAFLAGLEADEFTLNAGLATAR